LSTARRAPICANRRDRQTGDGGRGYYPKTRGNKVRSTAEEIRDYRNAPDPAAAG